MGIQTNVSFFAVISFNAFWKFLWPGYSAWDFLVLNFGLGIFWGFDFCPIRSSLSHEIQSTSSPGSGVLAWGVFLGILGGGVLPGSPNPEKSLFPHQFSDLASKIYSLFQTWPPRNYVIITNKKKIS